MDGVNRRRFLGTAIGTGAAAATAGVWTPAARARGGGGGGGGRGQVPNNRIGIQLYTMRRLMPANDRQAVRRVLNWLGRAGYTEVEMAGYYGFTARQVRNWLDDAGLRAASGHDPLDITVPDGQWEAKYQKTLEDANTLGQKLTGFAWFPGPYTAEYFKFLADRFNKAGAMASRAGLQFFYHNHDFEFLNKQPDGSPVYDILLEECDRKLVKFELDLFWITEGGSNAVEYLSADPSRFFAYHVKDHVWGRRANDPNFEDAGPGMLDFPDLFDAGDGRGLDKHYFIEHDMPWLSHPNDPEAEFKTAKNGIQYLENVRW